MKHHPDKDISEAIAFALARGWRFKRLSGHSFGELLCPWATREGCRLFVMSTPRNSGNHASRLRREVLKCVHEEGAT